jgi:hypothetical protein
VVTGTLGVGIVVAGILVAVNGGSSASCKTPDPLVVAAAPNVKPIIQDAANRVASRDCVAPLVIAQDSAATASDLTDPAATTAGAQSGGGDATSSAVSAASSPVGTVPVAPNAAAAGQGQGTGPGIPSTTAAATPLPSLWIPDSALWPKLAAAGALGTQPNAAVDVGSPIAMTPLVVAAPRALLTDAQNTSSWSSVLSGTKPAVIANPTSSTDGLSSLAVISMVAGNGPDRAKNLVGSLLRIAHATVPNQTAAFATATSDRPAVFPASEQSIIAFDRSLGRAEVTGVYPKEGTIPLELPVVRLTRPSDTPGTSRAANALEKELHTPETLRALQAAGFRSPAGDLAQGFGGNEGVKTEPPPALPDPPLDQLTTTAKLWSAVTLNSRLLNVIDISGTMSAQADAGHSRIQLAIDSSLTALALFPDSAAIGLWAFSTKQDGNLPYKELAPARPLSDQVAGGTTNRQYLIDQTKALAGEVGGGTGLYDTILAAVRTMRAEYDPNKINLVTLITDGKDEGGSGLTLQTLLTQLRGENDPTRPVAVIGIGIGPDADLNALRQITSVTGGKAYGANNSADMQSVFLDALSVRRCRTPANAC